MNPDQLHEDSITALGDRFESKHTEGPWYVCERWSDELIEIGSEQTEKVALIEKDHLEDEETLANAKLIAAAPDLLKALESAVFDLKAAYEVMKIDKQKGAIEFIQKLEAVIKKATV